MLRVYLDLLDVLGVVANHVYVLSMISLNVQFPSLLGKGVVVVVVVVMVNVNVLFRS